MLRLLLGVLFLVAPLTVLATPRIDSQEVDCLAKVIYTEARGEGRAGMIAVAHVVINRSESGKYPKNLCEVAKQPYQFEGMLHANKPIKEPNKWEEAKDIATLTFYGIIKDTTNGALYFHANYIKPNWAYVKNKTLSLGNHIFYK